MNDSREVIKGVVNNTLVTAASISGDPALAILTGFVSPLVAEVVSDTLHRNLSNMQAERLKLGIGFIGKAFSRKRSAKMLVEKDRGVTEILEGILMNIQDEYERKKIESHANMFVNVCLEANTILDDAFWMLRVIKQLSYRQLILIAYAHKQGVLETNGWDAWIKRCPELKNHQSLYSEILSLYNLGILEQDINGVSLSLPNLKLSGLGRQVIKELDLMDIPSQEFNSVQKEYYLISNEVKRLGTSPRPTF